MANTFSVDLFTESTGKEIVGALDRQNLLLTRMITAESDVTPVATLNEIHEIVMAGEAPNVFHYGDQINVNYNNGTSDFILPFDITHFGDVVLQDGETVPGMFIQSHYAMQPVAFDGNEAFYVDYNGSEFADLPAGTYHFTMGNSWGSNVVAGKTYQFTTTQAGKLFQFGTASSTIGGLPDQNPANWRVLVFANQTDLQPLERVALTEGTDGTDLGTLSSSQKYSTTGINNMQRASYGYGRYGHSAMMQWLNSPANAGGWWAPQNPFDRPPDQLASLQGFMKGFNEAFLNILKPVRVRTALNTTSDSELGTYEDVYNTFFPASLEEEYIVPQLSGVEGEAWEYWKRRLGITSPQAYHPTVNAAHIRYAYENRTSAQSCRLRSAIRGYAYSAWFVYSTGYAYSGYVATGALRCAPACVIC